MDNIFENWDEFLKGIQEVDSYAASRLESSLNDFEDVYEYIPENHPLYKELHSIHRRLLEIVEELRVS